MHEQLDDQIMCAICSDVILIPARLACKHEFCCYCIRSIKYEQSSEVILCPFCRKEEREEDVDWPRGRQIITHILTDRKDMRVFYGDATTVNNIDKNETNSKKFFLLLKDNKVHADIYMEEGSKHNAQVIGRLEARVKVLENGSIMELDSAKCYYSNTAKEDWKGVLKFKGDRRYESEKATYEWRWHVKYGTGVLLINLVELEQGKTLRQQGIE